ncbi:disease resistance RPP13-like protein 4 [Camellia sinensis]|uniref:disease resistance RPP13-like protein 4 n=1 Tax=Camellia sinensis TaxID=4442 RepID=UPI001035DA3E|nr:disease resistance RPP13-like protein 4 [Camellia sinensis]
MAEEIANGKIAEDYAKNYFDQLMAKGFIEPTYEMRHELAVGRCKMHAFICSAVIMFAERANFFNFDRMGNPTEHYFDSYRACLRSKGFNLCIVDLKKLHMLFNLDGRIMCFEPEWFYKMKNIKVLYLGSLQGISRITKLPHALPKLVNLVILDIKACHNLVEHPERISSLKNLTHLDMSKCHLLEHMPKGLALLSELQVLKFITLCTLAINWELESGTTKSTEVVSKNPNSGTTNSIAIATGNTRNLDRNTAKSRAVATRMESGTEKSMAVVTRNSNSVMREAVRFGGRKIDSGQEITWLVTSFDVKWAVKALCLKYLRELKMDWSELRDLFPDLSYLEKVKCPKLFFFPCNNGGVWRNRAMEMK